MTGAMRTFAGPETGHRVRALVALRERSQGGVSPHVHALVFETPGGRWIGALPVHVAFDLQGLTERELGQLLDEAVGREAE